MRALCLVMMMVSLCVVSSTRAEDGEKKADEKKKTAAKAIHETLSTTTHEAVIDGQTIAYTATAGRLTLVDKKDKPQAKLFFVAYTRDVDKEAADEQDATADRPVTFCFNGGPGSSSVWLHLGMLGPKKVDLPSDAGFPKPPYRLVDNPHSLLDVTDLVFIDPVSTGYSRPEDGVKKSNFHGFHEDVRSVGQFIHDYVTRFERWGSPKFLLGESYGGLRAAGLSGHLRDRYRLELNGAVIVSGAVDFQTLRFGLGNDLPYVTFLPTYAATAWYHKALPEELQKLPLEEVVRQAEKFAFGKYAKTLLAGDRVPEERLTLITEQFARLTGLSTEYASAHNLRVSMSEFGKELLRDRDRIVGRFDSRYLGIARERAGEWADSDPSGDALFGAFTSAMNVHLRENLDVEPNGVYEILTGDVHPWNYDSFRNRYVNASETLREAMAGNPYLKVFVACGYYDLATPHGAMDYTISHLGLTKDRRPNVTTKYYEGGHMMYVHKPSLKQLREDLKVFYHGAVD